MSTHTTSHRHRLSEKEAANVQGGGSGFVRIAAGESHDFAAEGRVCVSIVAVGGDVTFDACMSAVGDDIAADDTLLQEAVRLGVFNTVAVDSGSAGVAYAYYG